MFRREHAALLPLPGARKVEEEPERRPPRELVPAGTLRPSFAAEETRSSLNDRY